MGGALVFVEFGEGAGAVGAGGGEDSAGDGAGEGLHAFFFGEGGGEGDVVVGGGGVEEAAAGVEDAGLGEVEGEGEFWVGDFVEEVFGAVEVGFCGCGVVFFDVEAADAHPGLDFGVVGDFALGGFEVDALKHFGGVDEVFLFLVGVGHDFADCGILFLEGYDAGLEGLQGVGSDFYPG